MHRMLLDQQLVPQRRACPHRVIEQQAYVVFTDDVGTSLVTLDETGTAIWQLVDGQRSIADILAALAVRYDTVGTPTWREEALAFLERLRQEHLIDWTPSAKGA